MSTCIVTPCHAAVMYMIQSYPKLSATFQPMPAMLKALALPGPDPGAVHKSLAPLYVEFRLAQIKTMSYAVALLRQQSSAEAMKPHAPQIVESLVHLFRLCPDNITARRDLLHMLRGVINSPHRCVSSLGQQQLWTQ